MTKFYISIIFSFAVLVGNAQEQILGFTPENSKNEQALEASFDAKLSAVHLDSAMHHLAAQPHFVGSDYDRQNAEWILKQFKDWGYDAHIETYQILFPYPKSRLLELTGPTTYKAKLGAVPIEEDKYTQQGDLLLPGYNAFSTDGDVEAELVFVNYGVPSDYEQLEKMGISVKGKIVIAKYYGSWRGIKPKLAAEKGAIGCIIYSDPADDGYGQGDVYPKGAFKDENGVQRGSVMDMPLYPGDVLTPGYAATKDAKRLDRKDAKTITKIPVLPISYGDAKPLLAALDGPVVPSSWQGGLPITYHIGPGPAKVHLKLEFDWKLTPIYDVVAKMKGSQFPDEWIMRGNHHDAWVHGAADPISGQVAMMEEARAIGELAKAGQRPKRTIVYFAWDAEEPGLIGSTEWVEGHQDELKSKGVAYINTDSNGRGFLGAGGSHTLQAMVKQVANEIEDPQTGVSVLKRRSAANLVNGGDGEFKLSALGSGSDYTPFIQHTGVPSLNLGFGGEDNGGDYHTIFDTYTNYKRFKDPDFSYGVALAKTAGHIVLRLANADVLPFEFQQWYSTVNGYLEEVMKETSNLRTEVEKHNKMVAGNDFELAADPTKPFVKPEKEKTVPHLDFSALENIMADLKNTIDTISEKDMLKLNDEKKKQVNQKLMGVERSLTNEKGLPRRPWFKHEIYAPGFYTGYGVKTLPGVREAIEQKNWKEAQEQISILTETLNNFNSKLQEIIKLM